MTLIGHEKPWNHLCQAFYGRAFHPAWLITGERGIGKATFAYAVAREILCDGAEKPGNVARQMAYGSYPNFLVLEGNSTTGEKISCEITVEEARKISTFLRSCATIPGWRVILVDAVDEMNPSAANTLLKVLEEPPAQTVFLLITHSIGHVLPTIRSRCYQLPLTPLNAQEVPVNLPASLSPEVLVLAEGSLGKALTLNQAGGIKLQDRVIYALEKALMGNWTPGQELSRLFEKTAIGYRVILEVILACLYRLIILAHQPLAKRSGDDKLADLGKSRPVTHWIDAYQRVNEFLKMARTSHLDQQHMLMAIFYIVENPLAGDDFIYG